MIPSTLRNPCRVLLVLCGVLAAAGCGGPEGEGPTVADPTPRRGGTLRLAVPGDPGTLNPLRMTTSHASRVFALLQPGLVRMDAATGDWNPGLARAWSLSEDGRVLDLQLDLGYRWSDGERFGSEDVVASFALYADEAAGYPRRSRLERIEEVTALDEERVRIRFSQRVLDPLGWITHDILPAHLLENLRADEVAQWPIGQNPVTLGAYRLESWQHNGKLKLVRNPHYGRGDGYVDAIEISVLPDANLRWLQLSTGELDVADAITVDQARSLDADSPVRVESLDGRSVAFLQYNLENRFLADARVRRALSAAVDRDAICEGIFAGYARPAATVLPPVSWAHDEGLLIDAFDLDHARALMGEAGYVLSGGRYQLEGERVELEMLYIAGDPLREAVAQYLVQQWSELGVTVRARPVEIASLVRVARSPDFQMMLAQLGGPVDADLRLFLRSDGRFNFGHVSIDAIDRALDAATSAGSREGARVAARELQAQIALMQPVTPLYFPQTLVVLSDRVRGATPDWLSPFSGIEAWWVRADR